MIRSHTVIYTGSMFGERLETGHHVVIREKTQAKKIFESVTSLTLRVTAPLVINAAFTATFTSARVSELEILFGYFRLSPRRTILSRHLVSLGQLSSATGRLLA